jgi:hypothetical protein
MFTLSLTLPIIASALRLWLVVRLYAMNRHREYPLFVAYNLLAIMDFVTVITVMRRPVTYFLTYWIGEILLSILALLVLLAVFKPAGEGLYARHPSYRAFLPFAITTIIAIVVWQTIYHPLRPTPLGHTASGMYSFVLGVLVLEATILTTCLALAFSRRVSWTRYDFAIVAGFGLSALPKLISFLVWWNVGRRFEAVVHFMTPAAAVGAALIWVVAFSRSEPQITRQAPSASELQKLTDLLEEHAAFVRQLLGDPRFRRRPLPDQPR